MNIFTVSVPTQAVLCQICITCQVYVSYIRYHWFCIVTNPIIFCNILMSVGQPYETFGNKAEDQLTSFPRLSYIICMYNIHPRTQKTSCFHFHHFVIELKPYIKRRFIDGAQWPTRCHNSAVRSCRFVIRWCLFLWGGQTQLKQHWTSNFERTITDKWNTTLLPCS